MRSGRVGRVRLVVVAVVAAALLAGCGGDDDRRSDACSGGRGGTHAVVFLARAGSGRPVTPATLAETVDALCDRARRLGLKGVSVGRDGDDAIAVSSDDVSASVLRRLGVPGRLDFYDWEPNLLPASQTQPTASLFAAVDNASVRKPRAEATDLPPEGASASVEQRLGGDAAKIRAYYDRLNDSAGDKYYLFGPGEREARKLIRPGQPGASNDAAAFYGSCAELARDFGVPPARSDRPGSSGSAACSATLEAAERQQEGPPRGSEVVRVPRGVVVLKGEQGAGSGGGAVPAGYWTLEDDSELSGQDIEDPQQSVDPQTNEPIATFQFTEHGRRAFERATRREAVRGASRIAPPGTAPEATFQRFAISLDYQLVSLATIDYRANPDGIDGSNGAQINGIGDADETRRVVELMKAGRLPVDLVLISSR